MLDNKQVLELIRDYRKTLELAKWPFLKGISSLKATESITHDEEAQALQCLNPAHITTKSSLRIQELGLGASFRVLLSNYILEKKFLDFSIAPGANDKITDAFFLDKNGFKVPEIYDQSCSYIDINRFENCIVKPVSGSASKGVFIKQGSNYKHLYDKSEFSEQQFLNFSIQNSFRNYLVEELISSPEGIHDFKFYMFYGEVGVILEIDRNSQKNKYCYYDSSGKVVNTGKYEDSSFIGLGFTTEMLEVATQISKLIPSPFIRVDLLGDKSSFKVGELTAHPGGYENFNNYWDYKLGILFLEARASLFNDLLQNVSFDSYLSRNYKVIA